MEQKVNAKVSKEDAILKYIKNNKTVTVGELTRYFNYSDNRQLRKAVESLRIKGEPICNSTKGYYYSENPEDVEKTINSFLKQANGLIEMAEILKDIKEKLELQKEKDVLN